MKIIITENQYELLKETKDKPKVYNFPSLEIFGYEKPIDNWNLMQKFLDKKGNPEYTVGGDIDLRKTPIESLGNLTSVGGYLDLYNTPIKSLGNLTTVGGYLDLSNTLIESLGNLTSVGGYLDLYNTPIKSLGNLTTVGGDLDLTNTPISQKYTRKQIRSQVDVKGKIRI